MQNHIFPPSHHDHKICIRNMMQRAENICSEKKLRLTDLRRSVLEVIAAGHTAFGAYELIDKLKQRGRNISPISIYRILDFLLHAGLIHRLESDNAFFACYGQNCALHCATSPVIFICGHCGLIGEAESTALDKIVRKLARQAAFKAEKYQIEIKGTCVACAQRVA